MSCAKLTGLDGKCYLELNFDIRTFTLRLDQRTARTPRRHHNDRRLVDIIAAELVALLYFDYHLDRRVFGHDRRQATGAEQQSPDN
jgi:hypothetical protein